jgi:hypothetical protein
MGIWLGPLKKESARRKASAYRGQYKRKQEMLTSKHRAEFKPTIPVP